jgi:RNA polymerase-binding transcription factor DksA
MDQETLATFRRTLQQRHHSLLERRQHALAAEDDLLIERELDPEDTAAAGSAAALLDSLGETQGLVLLRVEAALVRIEQGGYGRCARCGEIIDGERLRAVPDTDQCGGCAAAR